MPSEFLVFHFREKFLEFNFQYTLFDRKHFYRVAPTCHLAIFTFEKLLGENAVGYSFPWVGFVCCFAWMGAGG